MRNMITLLSPGSTVTRVGDIENTKCIVIETIISNNSNGIYYKLRFYKDGHAYTETVSSFLVIQHGLIRRFDANMITVKRLIGKCNKKERD